MTGSVWGFLTSAYAFLNARAGWILTGGLVGVAGLNIWLWVRDRRRLRQMAPERDEEIDLRDAPRVSFLIPAWNEGSSLRACLQSILDLRYPRKEILVCAGGDDNTLQLAREYDKVGVIVLEQTRGEGKQGALRRCFARSSGEIIFLTDADCVLDDESFERTLAPVVSGQEQATGGSWRPLDRQINQPFVQHQWAFHLYREVTLPDHTPTLDGRNAAVRREVLEEVGAFEVQAPIGTDYVLSQQLTRAGYPIRFVRHSRVQTAYPQTISAYLNQISRWLRNPLVVGRLSDEGNLAWTHLRAEIIASGMLGVPLVAALGSHLIWSIWLLAATHLYLGQVRVMNIAQARVGVELTITRRLLHLFAYMLLGWIAQTRALAESLLPARRNIWGTHEVRSILKSSR
jgi:cellulose synthase/poly-beta-1,6-N-acetylglucosamine synthase-like glycosyltransferase